MPKDLDAKILERHPEYQRGYARIDLDAIRFNMDQMHANIDPDTKMLGVIKANGYGHGALEIGRVLEDIEYVWGYATASFEEAVSLREGGLLKPILILGYTFPYCYDSLSKYNIRPAVFRYDQVDELSAIASKSGANIKIHIKVDTGMGRIGITPDEAGLEFVKYALSKPGIEVEGIFTHFAKADEFDKTHVHGQISKFKSFTELVEQETGYRVPIRHCSNSAGIVELPEANMDMVRAGITLYGLMPSEEVILGPVELKPVMSVYSHISFVKTIHAGQSVSYGGVFVAQKDTRVATVPLGYADGYPRQLTGKGEVLICGKRCPIIGRICMDQFMVDVTSIPDIHEGELVTLLGRDGDEIITAEEIGDLSGRFNYELVCLFTDRLPRVYEL